MLNPVVHESLYLILLAVYICYLFFFNVIKNYIYILRQGQGVGQQASVSEISLLNQHGKPKTKNENQKPKWRTKYSLVSLDRIPAHIILCRCPTSCMIRIHVCTLVSHGAMHDQQILNLLQPCSFPYLDLSNFIFRFIKNIF